MVVPGVSDYDLKFELLHPSLDNIEEVRKIARILKFFHRVWPIPVDFEILPPAPEHALAGMTDCETHFLLHWSPYGRPSGHLANAIGGLEYQQASTVLYFFDIWKKAQELTREFLQNPKPSWRRAELFKRRIKRLEAYWKFLSTLLKDKPAEEMTHRELFAHTTANPTTEDALHLFYQISKDLAALPVTTVVSSNKTHFIEPFDPWRSVEFSSTTDLDFQAAFKNLNDQQVPFSTYIITSSLLRLFWSQSLPAIQQEWTTATPNRKIYISHCVELLFHYGLMRYYRYLRPGYRSTATFAQFWEWFSNVVQLRWKIKNQEITLKSGKPQNADQNPLQASDVYVDILRIIASPI